MQTHLDQYAQIMLKIGLGFHAGQRLHITIATQLEYLTPEIIYLVRTISASAYQLGARNVITEWNDGELSRIRLQQAELENLDDVPPLMPEQFGRYLDDDDAFLNIGGRDPELMAGIDPKRLLRSRQAMMSAFRTQQQRLMSNDATWLVVNVPISSWAGKVYPDLSADEAVRKLWEQIFALSRVSGDDPLGNWQRHITDLQQRAAYLNGKQYDVLHYTAPGTDLHVGLPERHHWEAAGATAKNGTRFVPNIPTEEVFTMPDCRRINGTVSATLPFTTAEAVIEGMRLTFVDGRVVEATATRNMEALDALLNRDSGARSLGEVALVPNSSPIAQSHTIFHNTLYDENAACHLALGNAYPSTLIGGTELSAEALQARGANSSGIHNDFMIGSMAMDIDGILADGTVEPVMRGGEWAFSGG